MNTAAIYHRPESEFAYLYTEETMYSFAYGKRRHCLCPISARRSLSFRERKVVPTVVNYEEVSIYGVI